MTEPPSDAHAPAAAPDTGGLPPAGLDQRFYAFAVDRLLSWGLQAVAVWAAWRYFVDRGETATGVGLAAAAVLGIGLSLTAVQGLTGLTPGKALLGLRTVRVDDGTPIGVGRSLARAVLLWLATLPTFGLGLATLAWTAVSDPGRQRRGWHDHLAGSVVVDVHPVAESEVAEVSAPRQIVNLTAMRLVPAPPAPAPAAAAAPAAAPAPARLRWRVAFDTGEAFVVEGLGLVGRRPEARPGEPVRHVVPLPSADRSLSTTHAQFHLAPDGVLVVMDRGSTNGSVLVRQGVTRHLGAGKPATLVDGDLVCFGDRQMAVTRLP